jgi:hypothetical protein
MNISVRLPDPLKIAKEGLLEEVMASATYNADWAMEKMELSNETRELVHYAARHVASGVLDILDGGTDQGRYLLLPMSVITNLSDQTPNMAGGLSEALQDLYEGINN